MPRPGNTTDRGYGWDHQRLREDWRPEVEAGRVDCQATVCLMPTRRIQRGQAWQLGHTDDRSGYHGPEHRYCNESAGGRKGAQVTNAGHTALRHSRVWFPAEPAPQPR